MSGVNGLGGGLLAQPTSYPIQALLMNQYVLNGELFTSNPGDTADAQKAGFSYRGLNIIDEVLAASTRFGTDPGRSPYNSVQAYDPDEKLQEIKDRYNRYLELVTNLDPSLDLETAQTAAGEFVRADLLDDSHITAAVDSFEERSSGAFLRSVSRAAAGFFDIRAVTGTQFGQTLAGMERDRQAEVNDFERTLRVQYERDRVQAVTAFTELFFKAQAQQLDSQTRATALLQDIDKQEIVARQDQVNLDLDFEVKDAKWDLELFPYMNQTFSSLGGAAAAPAGQSRAERGLAMMGTAASILVGLGTAFL